MKNLSFLFPFSLLLAGSAAAQTVPVGMPVLEDAWRRKQLSGEVDSAVSFMLRPLTAAQVNGDSLFETGKEVWTSKKGHQLKVLPVTFRQQYNSHHPFGWNDGSMIPSNGYQAQLSAGLFARFGALTIQLQPEAVLAQNAGYTTFPRRHSDSLWMHYYNRVLDRLDAPERFGNSVYARLLPGQSSVRLNVKKLSIGVSTENLWWGPGVRNALLMSNNAPGFPHFTFNTTAPLRTGIGSFEGQVVSGLLQRSGFLPTDTARRFNGRRLYRPKPAMNRYLNGVALTWQPKWTKGLFLGFSRVFYMYTGDVQRTLGGYLPVVGQLFKGNVSEADREDSRKRDQMLSFFFRLALPKEKAEVYGEWGRNDHSGNLTDLWLQPEHSRAYILGLRKLFDTKTKGRYVELMAEFTNLQMPTTQLLRAQESWYAHYQVRDGYTHRGQVLGAGIGPGGNSQTVGLHWVQNESKTGLQLERITHNNDFYYDAFGPQRNYTQHWVDFAVQASKSWRHKRLLYEARFTWVRSVNFQWQSFTNVQNLQPALSVSYLF